ncbi:MAG: hypothetical protein ETSY2_34410 [Candidatus Entotheonella gemina]|uniref:Double Cache domain-containing protein n=1 Tax=Candidatus Entotheonella gemina TaxID=1429439 RepID=W4M002_9BACT|nr:MAG: hypothetical protein ETSY2_34410 [Candidatus Entotheonella gemina]
MRWWARSRLRTKIFMVFSVLILFLLLLTLGLTQLMVTREIERTLTRELAVTGQVFQRLLVERAERLLTNTTLLAGDFALRRVIAGRDGYDAETLESVAVNYRRRIEADLFWITDETGVLLADSHGRYPSGVELEEMPPLSEALDTEEAASAIFELREHLFQLLAVPVVAPDTVGFILLGTHINDALAKQLRDETGSQISFLSEAQVFASSWSRTELQARFRGHPEENLASIIAGRTPGQTFLHTLGDERYLSVLVMIPSPLSRPLYALIQRSYDEALAPWPPCAGALPGLALPPCLPPSGSAIGLPSASPRRCRPW